jgi:hypothetical protein
LEEVLFLFEADGEEFGEAAADPAGVVAGNQGQTTITLSRPCWDGLSERF